MEREQKVNGPRKETENRKRKGKGPKNLGVFLQETRAESKWGEGGAQEQVGTKEPEIDTCSMNVILTKHTTQDADGDKATAGDKIQTLFKCPTAGAGVLTMEGMRKVER